MYSIYINRIEKFCKTKSLEQLPLFNLHKSVGLFQNFYPFKILAITLNTFIITHFYLVDYFLLWRSISAYLMEDNGKTGFALEKALIIYFLKLYSFKKVKHVCVVMVMWGDVCMCQGMCICIYLCLCSPSRLWDL